MNTAINRDIFRAYDVRGVVGPELGETQFFTLGRALATRHPECRCAIVGRDGRLSSPALSSALIRGLNASGVDVVDVGTVPTPVLYFTALRRAAGSGLMVTGSHNPPEYNGLKMMIGSRTLAGDDIAALHESCIAGDFRKGDGRKTEVVTDGDYIRGIIDDIRLQRTLRIAIDCGNGVAGPLARALYTRLGCETTCLHCDIDGTFPNHHPNPSVPENLEELIDTVQSEQLDIGLAFDGDGDRLGVVDNMGHIIWADRQMMVFAEDVLRNHAGATIIYDVKSSRHLERVIERLGGVAHMCRTGHSFVKQALKDTGAMLAGEMSGHIFFNDRWPGFDDALYAGARLLEILSATNGKSDALFSRLPPCISTPEINVHFDREGKQHEFMRRFLSKAQFGDAGTNHIDGLRVELEDGWGLVRASNTTPCLVLRFEADDHAGLEKLQSTFRKQLLRVDPALEIPF